MRAHSVAAEGGTAAVLRPEEGDSLELHAWDTVKGSDFLADQDAVELFVRTMPAETLRLEPWWFPRGALILPGGGPGPLYNSTSYSHTAPGPGLALAFRAGAPLKDMEFV